MLQYSTEFARGRCAFADRYRFRAELSWSMVKGEPDYDRMVSNYMSKLEQDNKLRDSERAQKSGWHGFTGIVGNEQTSRFGKYLEPIGCLVEWVFLWPSGRDAGLESEILSSSKAETADRDGMQPWRVFGLDIKVPANATIESCSVQTARAELSFTDSKTGNTWQYKRLGLTPLWLKKPIEDWLSSSLRSFTRDLSVSRRRIGSVEIARAEGEFRPEGMHLRWGRIEARAWIDPVDGRLYCVRKMIRKAAAGGTDVSTDHLLAAAPEFTFRSGARPK